MRADAAWEPFKRYAERGPAEALCAQLEAEGVPTKLEAVSLENGVEAQYWVHVAKSLAHRARWVTSQLPPSDEELAYLATGKLPE